MPGVSSRSGICHSIRERLPMLRYCSPSRAEKGYWYGLKRGVLPSQEISAGTGKAARLSGWTVPLPDGKLNGYITGAYVYNKMGLTEQVATTITIATPNPVRRFRFRNLDIECVKAYCTDYQDDSLVPYLRLLDAIKDMKHIPGTTGQDIYNRLKSLYFNEYSLPELEKSYLWRKITRHVSERWLQTYWATSGKPYCKRKWQRHFFPRHGSTWIIKRHKTNIYGFTFRQGSIQGNHRTGGWTFRLRTVARGKDYWVSKILRDISLSEYADKTYFKGGTSLSKAYGLIERFSEDLDLFVFTGDKGASKQAEKTLNKKLSKYIAELNSDIYKEDLSETGGNYRKLYFSYDNVFQGVGLKEHLEVEIKSCDLPDKNWCSTRRTSALSNRLWQPFLKASGKGTDKHLRAGKFWNAVHQSPKDYLRQGFKVSKIIL